jgi:hypothetical protein
MDAGPLRKIDTKGGASDSDGLVHFIRRRRRRARWPMEVVDASQMAALYNNPRGPAHGRGDGGEQGLQHRRDDLFAGN